MKYNLMRVHSISYSRSLPRTSDSMDTYSSLRKSVSGKKCQPINTCLWAKWSKHFLTHPAAHLQKCNKVNRRVLGETELKVLLRVRQKTCTALPHWYIQYCHHRNRLVKHNYCCLIHAGCSPSPPYFMCPKVCFKRTHCIIFSQIKVRLPPFSKPFKDYREQPY